jgi:hypothetical protein
MSDRSPSRFTPRFFSALLEQLIDEGDVGRDSGKTSLQPGENCSPGLQHESVVLGSRHQDIALRDPQAPPKGCGNDEPTLRTDRHLDGFSACHGP